MVDELDEEVEGSFEVEVEVDVVAVEVEVEVMGGCVTDDEEEV